MIQDDDAAFAEDETARIAALHKSAPETIWLQVAPEAEQFDGLEAQTWCSDKINSTDAKYIKAEKIAVLQRELASEKERADYAWRNTNTIEKARQEEMAKRDALQAEVALLRHHLTELAKFADRAALVLVTIEAEDTTEGELLQDIVDGIQTWAPDAIRGQIAVSPAPTSATD